jgi:CO/xanthine dehydrogenase Mo-binding subunit
VEVWLISGLERFIGTLRHEPGKGGGEPAVICMGAVIANAIYDATGVRMLQLPMTPERVKQALSRI